jgi:hypothetical protein
VVTLARCLNEIDIGDLATQIGVGQHLLAGKGLSVYSLAGEDDLAKPARLLAMTHFPVGYSLYAAAMIGMGLSLGALTKLYFAIGTMLGWWGWAELAYFFCRHGLQRNRLWRWAGCAIALCTPLLFTPPWLGPDVCLWAAIPWVLMWVVRASDENASRARWFDWLAGLLCGLAILMRHAAIFLAIYAAFLILFQSGGRLKILARRWAAFAAGLFPLILPQIYINAFMSNGESIPDIFTLQGGVPAMLQRLSEGFWFFTSANLALAWWMPLRLLRLLTQSGHHALWLLCATLVGWALLLPMCAVRFGHRGLAAASRDVRIAAVGFFVALPLYQWGWTSVAEYLYVRDQRYYLPLLPLAIFIGYALAVSNRQRENKFQIWIGRMSLVYLAAYVGIATISVPLLLLPGESGAAKRVKLFGTWQFHHWPSMKLTYEFSPARKYVAGLLKDKPGTVLVTNHEEWFYADPAIDRSRVRRLKDLQASYVTGPASVLIAVQDFWEGSLSEVSWYMHYGNIRRGDYFRDLPGLHLVQTFPEEGIKILEASVPAGARIDLYKEMAELEAK